MSVRLCFDLKVDNRADLVRQITERINLFNGDTEAAVPGIISSVVRPGEVIGTTHTHDEVVVGWTADVEVVWP